jgi:hypothetical protein
VEDGGGGLTVSGVSRNRGGFVKCVTIQKRFGFPGLHHHDITLMIEVVSTSEMLVSFYQTWCNIPVDSHLHTHHCENLKCSDF